MSLINCEQLVSSLQGGTVKLKGGDAVKNLQRRKCVISFNRPFPGSEGSTQNYISGGIPVQVVIGIADSRWIQYAENVSSLKTFKQDISCISTGELCHQIALLAGLDSAQSLEFELLTTEVSRNYWIAQQMAHGQNNVRVHLDTEDFLIPELLIEQSEALRKGFTPFLSSILGLRFYQKMAVEEQDKAFQSLFQRSLIRLADHVTSSLEEEVVRAQTLGHSLIYSHSLHSEGRIPLKSLLAGYPMRRSLAFDEFGSTGFSLALARGSLSVRRLWVYLAQTYLTEQPLGEVRLGIIALAKELLWREFFKHRYRMFIKQLNPQPLSDLKVHSTVHFKEADFKEKLLQIEQIHIRRGWSQLINTGFISNRVRQWLASDWLARFGRDCMMGHWAFEYFLCDFDEALNWGNWSYISGQHALDPRGGRQFNIEQQVQRYDPDEVWQRQFPVE